MSETNKYPEKIISLAPALTEILFALGLSPRVVGVTDSCDYPAQVKNWPHVACWFDPDLAKLYALKPDLVLGLETAHRPLKRKLELKGIRVFLVNPITVDEAINAMAVIGDLLGVPEKAEILVAALLQSPVHPGYRGQRYSRRTTDYGRADSGHAGQPVSCGRAVVVPIRHHLTGRRPQCDRFDTGSLSEGYPESSCGNGIHR